MTSREQDLTIERISLDNDGESLCIRDGFLDQHIDLTLQSGCTWRIEDDGLEILSRRGNYSIPTGDWEPR